MSDQSQPVLFTEQPTLQKEFVDLIVDVAVGSPDIRAFLRKTIEDGGQQFESLDQLFGMLRAFFAQNMDATLKDAPLGQINDNLIEQALNFARFENQFRTERDRFETETKTNPDAVFWPNPRHPTLARPLIGAQPIIENLGLIDKSTPIGSAGSCFASEIAYYLQGHGYNYVVTESHPRDGNVPESSARWGIIFNTPSFRQLVEKAFGLRTLPRLVEHRIDGDYYQDPFRENIAFSSLDELEADRDAHIKSCRQAFLAMDTFVITLGLNECWEFVPDGSIMSRNPKTSHHFALFKHRVLTVEENVEALQATLDVLRAHNPGIKLIVTVSPVPLKATGLADRAHVITANSHSKAVLRTAAEAFHLANDEVYYFPSYEMVAHCIADPWEGDTRHVKREAVAEIMQAFEAMFVKPA